MANLGVIILNYYSSEDTTDLYKSLNCFKFQKINPNILVVDNSCDREEEMELKKFIPESNVLISRVNDGYAAGNNRGINHLKTQGDFEYFLILNPDIRLNPAILEQLIEHFRTNEKLAAIGPRIVLRNNKQKIYSDGGMISPYQGFLNPFHKNGWQKISTVSEKKLSKVDYIHGAFLLLSEEAISEIGLISEQYFLYFEEADWCQNAKLKGWDIMVDSQITASQSMSSQNLKFHFYFTRNHIIFNKKFNQDLSLVKLMKFYFRKTKIELGHRRWKLAAAVIAGTFMGLISSTSKKHNITA